MARSCPFGAEKDALCDAVCAAFDRADPAHKREVKYYPDEFFEPYLSRRRKVGWDLYGLLGIGRGDTAKMKAQHRRNFRFFDAPVGMIFTIHRKLETGSWLDYGMFLQNIMTAARARGLDTCAQAAWSQYHQVIRSTLGVPEDEIVVCGMALGYADRGCPSECDEDRTHRRAGFHVFPRISRNENDASGSMSTHRRAIAVHRGHDALTDRAVNANSRPCG